MFFASSDTCSCGCGGHHHDAADHSCTCGGHHDHADHQCSCSGQSATSGGCQGLRKYRRLHSVAGAVFAAFVIGHLCIAAAAVSPAAFDAATARLHTATHAVPAVEIIALVLLLAALVPVGVYLLFKSGLRYDTGHCSRNGKMRFFLQRLSAAVVLAFLALHLFTFGRLALRPAYHIDAPASSVATGIRQFFASLPVAHPLNLAIVIFYLLGILAVSYHLANGLWTGASVWKLLTTDRRKHTWAACCTALGVLTAAAGATAWAALAFTA